MKYVVKSRSIIKDLRICINDKLKNPYDEIAIITK